MVSEVAIVYPWEFLLCPRDFLQQTTNPYRALCRKPSTSTQHGIPQAMAALLPLPQPLETGGDVWQNQNTWESEFKLFSTATLLNLQPKEVQAATLLMTIGEEARKTYSTFQFEEGEDKQDVEVLRKKLESFYKPSTNLAIMSFASVQETKEKARASTSG